jgi:DNA invertase Pin-like site-specific DNA recombinase
MSGTVSQTDGQVRVAAIYARVSSERQRQEQTIQSQTVALRELAEQRELLVAEEFIFEDDGFSGASLQRPALERLRDRAFEGCFEVVLCHAPDRLARRYAYQVLRSKSSRAAGSRSCSPKSQSDQAHPRTSCCASFRG